MSCPNLLSVPLRAHVYMSVVAIIIDLSKVSFPQKDNIVHLSFIILIINGFSKPHNVISSLKNWLDILDLSLKGCRSRKEIEDDSDVPLMIVGNKYDIFKNEDR